MDRVPHPWNTGFEWQNHTGECTTVTAEQAAQFDEVGYFVLEDVFDRATLDDWIKHEAIPLLLGLHS